MKPSLFLLSLLAILNGCVNNSNISTKEDLALQKETEALNLEIKEMREVCKAKGYTWNFDDNGNIQCGVLFTDGVQDKDRQTTKPTYSRTGNSENALDLLEDIADGLMYWSIFK